MLAMNGSFERSTSVSAGCKAWSSEPELYQKISFMSPVARRVLTMLSPSVPPRPALDVDGHVWMQRHVGVGERFGRILAVLAVVDEVGQRDGSSGSGRGGTGDGHTGCRGARGRGRGGRWSRGRLATCGAVAAAGAVDVAAAGEQAVMSKTPMNKALMALITNVLVFIKLLQIVIENMRVVLFDYNRGEAVHPIEPIGSVSFLN